MPLSAEEALAVKGEWVGFTRFPQYPVHVVNDSWLVIGGRGSGKTRLGAEWVNGLARGFPPFAPDRKALGLFALIGETLGDVREVMIDGPSGIATISRNDRPRYEPSRRRLLFDNGAVAHVFSSEDPESLRGPQFEAAWCDEAGCPAIDKGANQPNVFYDPKSSESAYPYFSNGGRDDFAQRSYLEALLSGWDSDDAGFIDAANPSSTVYQGRMVEASDICLWAWDARPFPAFPSLQSVWSDGENWYRGHWLNGRLASISAGDLIASIVNDYGLPAVDTVSVQGMLNGYVLTAPGSARAALESLLQLFGVRDSQYGETLLFRSRAASPQNPVVVADMVDPGDKPFVTLETEPLDDLPAVMNLAYTDPIRDYQPALSSTARVDGEPGRDLTVSLPAVLEEGSAEARCAELRRAKRIARTSISFGVAHGLEGLAPGDIVNLASRPAENYEITEIEDGTFRTITARRTEFLPPIPDLRGISGTAMQVPSCATQPFVALMDLPLWNSATAPEDQLRAAVWSDPWQANSVSVSPDTTGFAVRANASQKATIAYLEQELTPGNSGRYDFASQIRLISADGEFSSVSRQLLLGGENLAAIEAANGAWEIVQFEMAEDLGGGSWLLSKLLRGQAGTEDAASAGAAAGARFVLLDDAVIPAGLRGSEIGLELNWRIEAANQGISGQYATDIAMAGGLRALTPYAPVHLKAIESADGSISFSWIRRGRIDADSWLPPEIPLGEDSEAYQVELSSGGALLYSTEVSVNAWTYSAGDRAADFGAGAVNVDLTIRQVSGRVGPGIPATQSFSFRTLTSNKER